MTQVARIFEEEKQQALTQAAKKYEEEKQQALTQVAKKYEEEKQALAQRTEQQIVIRMLERGDTPEEIVTIVSNYSLDDVEALREKLRAGKE